MKRLIQNSIISWVIYKLIFRYNKMSKFTLTLLLGAVIAACTVNEKEDAVEAEKQLNFTVEEVASFMSSFKTDSYGMRTHGLEVEDHSVQHNESFYEILARHAFSPQEIYSITNQAASAMEEFKFRPGQKYRTYFAEDSEDDQLERMIWQPNSLDYIVFDLSDDTLQVHKERKEVERRETTITGKISTSLYETLLEAEKSPLLTYKLSEVFAWEIDFFRLRANDEFKVVFEEMYVDGEFVTAGDILAAEFKHMGETYKAFLYDDGEDTGYYDEKGRSVQKALLKAPFEYDQRISSGFSNSRFHPVLKRNMPHHGVDYAAPVGTPVLSVGDGEVLKARYQGANGNIVRIRHNNTYETAYLHLNGFADGIRPGTRVKQGQVIGYVGNTGRSTGPHLDYRLYRDGSAVNPLTVELPSSESIPEEERDQYLAEISGWDNQLEELGIESENEEVASVGTVARTAEALR